MKPLTPPAEAALGVAASEAARRGAASVSRLHILLGVVSLDEASEEAAAGGAPPEVVAAFRLEWELVREVFDAFAVAPGALRQALLSRLPAPGGAPGPASLPPDGPAARALDAAEALSDPLPALTSLHLLAALLDPPDGGVKEFLRDRRADPARFAARARDALAKLAAAAPACAAPAAAAGPAPLSQGHGVLQRFCRDMTAEARAGKLGPYIGRRKELLQLIQTLGRKTKSNPVLVGEAGVGKTAIVEALALRAVEGKDDRVLKGVRIFELSLGALVGGAVFRGEFEERLRLLIGEIKADPKAILFIDELHMLIGAGDPGGAMDAANLLKPALARGDFRCIGATTIPEYRRYIEKDPALERRFEKIFVDEPSRGEALEMARGLRKRWEEFHGVAISPDALEAAVDLSSAFDGEHHLPDKAIDLLDRACMKARVPGLSLPAAWATPAGSGAATPPAARVSAATIVEVLAEKTGIPAETIANLAPSAAARAAPGPRLLGLEAALRGRVVGQDAALAAVSARVLAAHAGLGKRSRPLGVFLFVGPTGVGKTETARALADSLFGRPPEGDENPFLIRFDMSEFMQEHEVARLLGAPPGYVGHEEDPLLTGRLRTRPYAVVLFDEIEKAHPRVLDIMLQLFDDGRVTDSHGRTANARNALFVMTSNLGRDAPAAPIGFAPPGGPAPAPPRREALAGSLRPELLNRIDEIIEFRALGERDGRLILEAMVRAESERLLKQRGVRLEVPKDAMDLLLEKGFSPESGARELERAVARLLLAPLARRLLAGAARPGAVWRVSARGDALEVAG